MSGSTTVVGWSLAITFVALVGIGAAAAAGGLGVARGVVSTAARAVMQLAAVSPVILVVVWAARPSRWRSCWSWSLSFEAESDDPTLLRPRFCDPEAEYGDACPSAIQELIGLTAGGCDTDKIACCGSVAGRQGVLAER